MQKADVIAGSYLERFSLSRDPFEPCKAFFTGAGRQVLLGQLLHLSQFSSAVLVVSGALGSGRTCFAKKYAVEAEARSDHVCFIDVAKLHRPDELFSQLAGAYGLLVEDGMTSGELLAGVRQAVQELPLLLVCDGAELLDDRVLSALLSLLQGPSDQSPLRLLLTGDEQLVVRLDAFGMLDVLVQDWQLDDFSRDDVEQYLKFLLVSAGGVQDDVFSAAELERLWALSDGLPGRIQLPARELLIEKALQASEVDRDDRGVSVWQLAVAACCAAFLLMAFLYRADLIAPSETETHDISLAPPAVTTQADVPFPVLAPSPAVAPELSPFDEASVLGVQSAAQDEFDDTSNASMGNIAAEKPPALPQTTTEPVLMSVQASPTAELAYRAADIEPPVVAAPLPIATTVVTKSMAGEAALELAEQHLMSLDKGHFVLQVLGAASRESVERFVSAQENSNELYMFVTQRGGKPWYTVVIGDYPSRVEAQAAIGGLPKGQRVVGVWPRSVGDVHIRIGENRGI